MRRWFPLIKQTPVKRNKDLKELLVNNSPVVNRTHLKHRLIKEGYLENRCISCGNTGEWRGKKMTLEMDHINGNNKDNRLTNLRILCLNCHSQTPTFRRPKPKQKTIKPFWSCIIIGTAVWISFVGFKLL